MFDVDEIDVIFLSCINDSCYFKGIKCLNGLSYMNNFFDIFFVVADQWIFFLYFDFDCTKWCFGSVY